MNLVKLSDNEKKAVGTAPTIGALCAIARSRSNLNLPYIAAALGVSRVTVLAWERRSDQRLANYWREKGFKFPDSLIKMQIVRIGKFRIFAVGSSIKDHGVTAEWSRMKFVCKPKTIELDEHEYAVDEEHGVYLFSQKLHGRRSVAVSYVKIEN